jgi:phosphoribosylformylglycinamidine synthase
LGAAQAVLKCYRSIAALGAEPLAVTDCLNYGNPEDPKVMGQIVAGIEGIGLACKALGTPVVSGNVSLYNETDGKSIAPTPMIGMVGKHDDVRNAPGAILQAEGDIYLIRPKAFDPTLGGSLVAKVLEIEGNSEPIPPIDWAAEKEAAEFMKRLVSRNVLKASRDVGAGGVLTTLVKMALGGACGFVTNLVPKGNHDKAALMYFGESGSTYLFQVEKGKDLYEEISECQHVSISKIGSAQADLVFKFDTYSFDSKALLQSSTDSLSI